MTDDEQVKAIFERFKQTSRDIRKDYGDASYPNFLIAISQYFGGVLRNSAERGEAMSGPVAMLDMVMRIAGFGAVMVKERTRGHHAAPGRKNRH